MQGTCLSSLWLVVLLLALACSSHAQTPPLNATADLGDPARQLVQFQESSEIIYDPARIIASHRYVVRARILVNEKLFFINGRQAGKPPKTPRPTPGTSQWSNCLRPSQAWCCCPLSKLC
jgi:hypothetical protein